MRVKNKCRRNPINTLKHFKIHEIKYAKSNNRGLIKSMQKKTPFR